MSLPFSGEQFFSVFEKYNLSVWPMQVVLVLMAILAVILSIRKTDPSDKIIGMILGFLWLWIGIVYHLACFTTINKAAYLFGALYIIQGLIFILVGGLKSELSFKFQSKSYGIVGSLFILYALIIYPAVGYVLGHVYPQSPTFGLPCPTTIFTFGLLLWTEKAVPKYFLIIPLVWSIIGFGAALSLGVIEDYGLLIAGVLGSNLIMSRDRSVSAFFKKKDLPG
jgi:hypothetical protein